MNTATAQRLDAFAAEGIETANPSFQADSSPFWKKVASTGTRLWLDSGDFDGIEDHWCNEFSALTTNNTLLNTEVQKGAYDQDIPKAAELIADLDRDAQVLEIAFYLNLRHGLRLVDRFGCKVSVEMHTDLAHDVERTLHYARRAHAVCPQHFIVKVPHTPAGLLAARQLRSEGIPVNYTLGFSARINHVAAVVARPSFVNVFLGRCNGYVEQHGLGDGTLVGEKTTLASQRAVNDVNVQREGEPTRQIAASMREGDNVALLAGVDVMTMPLKVAGEAASQLDSSSIADRSHTDPSVSVAAEARPETLWEVSPAVQTFATSLDTDLPNNPQDLVLRAHAMGCEDMFPRWQEKDLEHFREAGKIPDHGRFADQITSGALAIDTLLNAGGLAAFTKDQRELDDRIRSLL